MRWVTDLRQLYLNEYSLPHGILLTVVCRAPVYRAQLLKEAPLVHPIRLHPCGQESSATMADMKIKPEGVFEIENASQTASNNPQSTDLKIDQNGLVLDPQPSDDPCDPLVCKDPSHCE